MPCTARPALRAPASRPLAIPCGFTLIELLLVAAVVALLAVLLFPVFEQAREATRRTRCLSNLRQLALAHELYVHDFDDTLPFWAVSEPLSKKRQTWVIWPEFLRPYYRDSRILDQGFPDQQERGGASWLADYALCAWGPHGTGTARDPYWRWPGAPAWNRHTSDFVAMRLAEVLRPAETMQFADGVTTRTTSLIRPWHRNGVLNGAFLDGHARLVSDEAWNRVSLDAQGYFYCIAAADR